MDLKENRFGIASLALSLVYLGSMIAWLFYSETMDQVIIGSMRMVTNDVLRSILGILSFLLFSPLSLLFPVLVIALAVLAHDKKEKKTYWQAGLALAIISLLLALLLFFVGLEALSY